MKELLWMLFAGQKGASNRARIVTLLNDRSFNANQISDVLGLDYTTIRHHLEILEEYDIITTSKGRTYGRMYFLSTMMKKNYLTFKEIMAQISEEEVA